MKQVSHSGDQQHACYETSHHGHLWRTFNALAAPTDTCSQLQPKQPSGLWPHMLQCGTNREVEHALAHQHSAVLASRL
jgi:hypothetical protein